jgi:hypothetical protein
VGVCRAIAALSLSLGEVPEYETAVGRTTCCRLAQYPNKASREAACVPACTKTARCALRQHGTKAGERGTVGKRTHLKLVAPHSGGQWHRGEGRKSIVRCQAKPTAQVRRRRAMGNGK